MRLNTILLITTAINLFAGAIFHAALGQESSTMLMMLCAVAAMVVFVATAWAMLKMRNAFEALTNSATESSDIGIEEFEQISKRLADTTKEENATKQELAEIKSFLEAVDRRALPYDRNGQPYTALGHLRAILTGVTGELNSGVRQLITSSGEVTDGLGKLAAGADQQTDVVEQTTAHLDSLSTHVINVGETAHAAVQTSASASKSASNSVADFKKLVEEIAKITDNVSARERKLLMLGQHSKEIAAIVQTIGTLSSRTDLLALNASIESVRAGEQGRGFAIVAEEVRALAEQSAQAVVDITSRIEMVQLETQESISATSNEHARMHDVLKRLNQTLDALTEVSTSSDDCAEKVNGISEATSRQLQVLQSIVETLEKSSNVSRKNRIQAEGTHWTAKTLAQSCGQLAKSLQFSGALCDAIGTTQQQRQVTTVSPAAPAEPVAV